MSVAFPESWNGKSLKTSLDNRLTKVHYERHNEQIDTLERRDLYLLDFLSRFDALPIGSIMPTTIPYASNNMPPGWIWADGRKYGKTEGTTASYEPLPKLWEKVKAANAYVYLSEFVEMCQNNGYVPYGGEPDDHTPFGLYVTPSEESDYFWVPTLNDVFLMSITAGNRVNRTGGLYEPDKVGDHIHNIKSYPVNGANLNTSNEIGVALTDKITEKFETNLDDHYIKDLGMYKTENNNATSGVETKPKSISYYYMIKADMTNFDPASLVDTDCSSVSGYKPSISAPASDNLAERVFPVPNPENGKIGTDWFDTTGLAVQVLNEAESQIVNIVNDSAILKSDTLVEWDNPTTNPVSKIPMSDSEGKIDSRFIKTVTTAQIESLF